MRKTIFTIIILLVGSNAWAEYLVEGNWLIQNMSQDEVFILDIQAADLFQRHHVPGSVNAPYSLWRTDKRSLQPGMLPAQEELKKLLNRLGISTTDQVVIVNTGIQPADTAAAARVFWTLKIAGLQHLAILNGGLAGYVNKYGGRIVQGSSISKPSSIDVTFGTDILADTNQVEAALNKDTQLIDSRSLGEYWGVIVGAENHRSGTLPAAHHLPFDWLVDINGNIRGKNEIVALFDLAKIDPKKDGNIHFCSSGNRAALSWFIDYAILGHTQAKLYDGSMNEWAVNNDLPMERKIDLPN